MVTSKHNISGVRCKDYAKSNADPNANANSIISTSHPLFSNLVIMTLSRVVVIIIYTASSHCISTRANKQVFFVHFFVFLMYSDSFVFGCLLCVLSVVKYREFF